MGDEEKLSSLQGSSVPLDKEEEIVDELKNCLPKWVTQEQVTDMIRGTWKNLVEIVDDFYEHETQFYNQVSAVISFTSKDGISSGEALVSKLEENDTSSQFHKLKSMSSNSSSSSQKKSSLSPVKRKGKIKAKPKKRGKAFNSKVESVGPKQASITKFFNKAA